MLALLLVFLLQGCAFNSFLFNAEENNPIVIIEYPPNRVAYGGNMNKADIEALKDILIHMEKGEFHDYKHSFPFGVGLQAIVQETRNDTFDGTSSIGETE